MCETDSDVFTYLRIGNVGDVEPRQRHDKAAAGGRRSINQTKAGIGFWIGRERAVAVDGRDRHTAGVKPGWNIRVVYKLGNIKLCCCYAVFMKLGKCLVDGERIVGGSPENVLIENGKKH